MELVFEPLSKENIDRAIDLAHSIFAIDAKEVDNPEKAYRASLVPHEYGDFFAKYNLISLQYFLVRESVSNRIVGITGWYNRNTDPENMVWLGWYGVASTERGKGFGKEILLRTIDMVKSKGFTIMRLFTSNTDDERVAQKLYESLDFKVISEEKDPKTSYKILYREKDLTK